MKRIKSINWYLKKYWWKYLLTIILSIMIIYCDIKKPEIIGEAVDIIGLGQITSNVLLTLLISLVMIVLLKYVVSIIKSICLGNLFHKLFYHIKMLFMKNILKQDAAYFVEYHPGDLMTRATSDTFAMANVCTHLIFSVITLLLTLALSSISMVKLHPLLTLFSVLPLPFIFIVVVLMRPKISDNWRLVHKKASNLSNLAMESVQHVKLIRAFVSETEDCNKLKKSAQECCDTAIRMVNAGYAPSAMPAPGCKAPPAGCGRPHSWYRR